MVLCEGTVPTPSLPAGRQATSVPLMASFITPEPANSRQASAPAADCSCRGHQQPRGHGRSYCCERQLFTPNPLFFLPRVSVSVPTVFLPCRLSWEPGSCSPALPFSRAPNICTVTCFSWVTQSCPAVCDPIDGSPPGSSVRGILQARILKWVAISFSGGSPRPGDWSCVSCLAGRFFTTELPGKRMQSLRPDSFTLFPRLHLTQLCPISGLDNLSPKSTLRSSPQPPHLYSILCSDVISCSSQPSTITSPHLTVPLSIPFCFLL